MHTIPVKSSHIESLSFSQEDHRPEYGILTVQYKDVDGNLADSYRYYNIHINTWVELQRAQSKGGYINTRIKGRYQYVRLGAQGSGV